MSANVRKGDFFFDCIVERPRAAPFGGPFGVIVALLILFLALATILPVRHAAMPAAGEPNVVHAA